MKIITKRRNWWKRPLAVMLSATLVASSFSMVGVPKEVQAATVGPGGVMKQPHLWLRADQGVVTASGKVSKWKDQSGRNVDFVQNVDGNRPTVGQLQNFNPVVLFDRNQENYLHNKNGVLGEDVEYDNFNVFTAADFQKGINTSLFWEKTSHSQVGNGSRVNLHLPWSNQIAWDAGKIEGHRLSIILDNLPENANKHSIWNFNFKKNDSLSAYRNGEEVGKLDGVSNANSSFEGVAAPMILGAAYNSNAPNNEYYDTLQNYFKGQVGELIFYKDELSKEEREKINTYLAVKYGITLNNGASNYVATNDGVVWTADSTYKYNIAGIARDDAEGLHQKQSQSINEGIQVAIGLGELVETNADNTNDLTDGQYLIWGDNGGELTFTQSIDGTTEKYHAERIWKVQNTNGVEEVQIAIPAENVPADITLLKSNSESFVINQEVALNPIMLNSVKYYAAKVIFADGDYFTFAAPAPKPTSAMLEQAGAEGNKITLTFDKEVELSSPQADGFTITVDSEEVTLQDGDFEVDSNDSKNLIITLPNDTDVTGKTVKVSYKGDEGNLKGTNGAPVQSFNKNAEDPFAAALKITSPDTETVTTARPEIKGTVEEGSTVEVVIKDSEDQEVENAGGSATVTGTTWTFTPTEDLENGDYTIEVTATKDGKTAIKTKAITVAVADETIEVMLITPAEATVNTGKPTFSGTATPDATVTVKLAEGNELTTTADANGDWSVTPTDDLADGTYNVEITAEMAGKISTLVTKVITISTSGGETPVNKNALQAKVAEIDGENLTEANYTPSSWQAFQNAWSHAQIILNDETATQSAVDAALLSLTSARNGLIGVNQSNGLLISLVPSYGSLSPSFSSEQYHYSLSVGYGVSQLPFSAVASDPFATIEMSVNGQSVTTNTLPLVVGRNDVVITVTDSQGHSKHYTITVIRDSGSDGGSSGGGGGTPSTPSEPSAPTKETIVVDLEIDGDQPLEKTSVTIERTKETDGRVNDHVALTPNQAQEAVDKAKQIGNHLARIVIPDAKDEVDEVNVGVSRQSIETLRDNGIHLEILTDNAKIELPVSSMDGIDDDVYFRLVPIKKESERQEIEERAQVEQVVRAIAGNEDVNVVARPMTIETNLSSRPVTLTLPLRDVALPADEAARQAYLKRLGVFIEHSDGEKEVVFGDVVTMENGELGLRFTIDKFSTFTIIELPDGEQHEAYINGFPNGLFKPNEAVTRAQVAAMVARNLGYTGSEQTNIAPFHDVAPSHYASGVIRFVKEAGLMTGDPNGHFRPNDTMTRAEMATMMVNYKQLGFTTNDAPSFHDTDGHWAKQTIELARQAGLVTGYENGEYRPNRSLTRAEAVAMLNRLFERGPLYGVTTPSFPDVRSNHWAFNDIEEAATTHQFYVDEKGKEYVVN